MNRRNFFKQTAITLACLPAAGVAVATAIKPDKPKLISFWTQTHREVCSYDYQYLTEMRKTIIEKVYAEAKRKNEIKPLFL